MEKNRAQAGEYFSLEDLLLVMRQELDDAREEHNRLSDLICRCYVFLYIRLPFDGRFSVVPNHTVFAYQKK